MRVLVVSDVHLGNGGVYDIYAGGAALPALIRREAGPDLHLVLNGDAVDFLLSDDPLGIERGRAVRAAEAIAQHPESRAVFEAIGELLAQGGQVEPADMVRKFLGRKPSSEAFFREITGRR